MPDGPGKTMLGRAQRRWLVEGVTSSTATWKVVVSSVTLSLPTGRSERRDGWSSANVLGLPQDGAGFATERDAILGALRKADTRNVIFVVADVHHAELIRHHPHLDWSFHEFVAGPLNAGTFGPNALDATFGPQLVFQKAPPAGQSNPSPYAGFQFFGEVNIDPSTRALTVDLRDLAGVSVYSRTLSPA